MGAPSPQVELLQLGPFRSSAMFRGLLEVRGDRAEASRPSPSPSRRRGRRAAQAEEEEAVSDASVEAPAEAAPEAAPVPEATEALGE